VWLFGIPAEEIFSKAEAHRRELLLERVEWSPYAFGRDASAAAGRGFAWANALPQKVVAPPLKAEAHLKGLTAPIGLTRAALRHGDGIFCRGNTRAESIGIGLGELSAEKYDLRRVIDPQE
jgi:hypothetical protein